MKLQKDLKEFIELLNSHKVEYLVVGAYNLALHSAPRFTGDIDIFVRVSSQNSARLEKVIQAFGFGSTGLCAEDFLKPDQVIQLGIAPHRIDILTGLSGVEFDQAWATKESTHLDKLKVCMLSKELLIKNKLATGRPQDLADVERLQKME